MANIILNGKDRVYNQEKISYAQVIALAFSNMKSQDRPRIASITFKDANQEKMEGILSPKGSVKIKEGTKFTCHVTSNA